MKNFLKKENAIGIAVAVLVTAFMLYYPYMMTKKITSAYTKGLSRAVKNLSGKEKKAVEEALSRTEKGQLFAEEEHDTSDYMHESYFGEPWREWKNTALIWIKARQLYLLFLLGLILYGPINKSLDWLSLEIIRQRSAAAKTGKSQSPVIKPKFAAAEPVEQPPQAPAEKGGFFDRINLALPMPPRVLAVVAILLFGVTIFISPRLSAERTVLFPTNVDRSIGMQLFTEMIGEMRSVIAAYIYIRADMYHHEREDKVSWKKDPVTLPLYRLITSLDPKMVNAYDFGAYHLAVNFKKYNEGLKFLQEGLRYNPDNPVLYHTMGDIYYFKGDFTGAAKAYDRSLYYSTEQIDLRNNLRRLYWCYRKMKDYPQAAEYLRMWAQLDPRDAVIQSLAKELYLLSTGQKHEKDFQRVKATEEEITRAEKKLEDAVQGGMDPRKHMMPEGDRGESPERPGVHGGEDGHKHDHGGEKGHDHGHDQEGH